MMLKIAARKSPLGWIVVGALALLAAWVVAAKGSPGAGAVDSCAGTINFAGMPAGEIIDDQYADLGVHILAEGKNGGPDALIVFDSNSTDTDLDADLRVGIGNIAIFANNLHDGNGDGLVDRPDENNYGGTATFTFDQDVTIGSFVFVDKDHGSADFAYAYDASANVIAQVSIPQASDGSVQTIGVNADGVRRFVLDYGDSGGFTGIQVTCEQPSPTPTVAGASETPAPTATSTLTPTATPVSETATPSPTQAPSTAPTPTVAGVEESPQPTPTPTPTPIPAPEVPAVDTPAPRPTSAVLGATNLPAAGGAQGPAAHGFRWAAALLAGTVVAGASFVWMRGAQR